MFVITLRNVAVRPIAEDTIHLYPRTRRSQAGAHPEASFPTGQPFQVGIAIHTTGGDKPSIMHSAVNPEN